jgi:hypothetical protein
MSVMNMLAIDVTNILKLLNIVSKSVDLDLI